MRLLGLGVLLLVTGLLVNAWLVLGKQFSRSPTFWRRWWGSLLLALSITGFMSLFRPDWHIGDVRFSEVTAGGDLGHAFMASPGGILAWLATTFPRHHPPRTAAGGLADQPPARPVAGANTLPPAR